MKILILMTYYNRPILVRNALASIRKAAELYQDWILVFGDDNSPIPGEPIVREMLPEYLDRITFINTNMSFNEKIKNGLAHGKYANQFIASCEADVAIILCDDDELVPTYLRDLATFFISRPNVMYCYSKVHIYNPLFQKSQDVDNVTGRYNDHHGPINPANKLDVSQVAFRLDCCKKHGVQFLESTKGTQPWIENLDGRFFQALYDKFGPAEPTNLIAQYKGIHDHQLVWHKKNGEEGLAKYIEQVTDLGGKRF